MNKPDTEPPSYLVLDYNSDNPYWSAGNARRVAEEVYGTAPPANNDASQHHQASWQTLRYPSGGTTNERPMVASSWEATARVPMGGMVSDISLRPKYDEDTLRPILSQDKTAKEDKNSEFVGLDLSGQAIKNLSVEISNYTFLTILKLDGNNLTSLPKEVCLMKNLVTLDVSNNKLQHIPAEICQLASLRELILYKNQLCALPHELGQLYMLNRLVLDDNPLDEPLMSIFRDGGAPAVMHYLCEMCPSE